MTAVTSFYVQPYEIDKMNIVYHAFYIRWFELGRMDFFNKASLSDPIITKQGFYLPVSQIECRFKRPARFGDEISVYTSIAYSSCVKLKFEYKIINKKSGNILAVGSTVHAWTDSQISPVNIEKSSPAIYSLLKKYTEITNKADKVEEAGN